MQFLRFLRFRVIFMLRSWYRVLFKVTIHSLLNPRSELTFKLTAGSVLRDRKSGQCMTRNSFRSTGPLISSEDDPHNPLQNLIDHIALNLSHVQREIQTPSKFTQISCLPKETLTCVEGSPTSSIGNKDFSHIYLQVLLDSLGCLKVRKDIVLCGLNPQKRWDVYGNVKEVTLQDTDIPEQITDLFSSQSRLEQAVQSCIQSNLVVQCVAPDGSLMYSTSNQSYPQISQSYEGEALSLLGLMFTAHIYPRDQTLVPL